MKFSFQMAMQSNWRLQRDVLSPSRMQRARESKYHPVDTLQNCGVGLTEGSMFEVVRRGTPVSLDPNLGYSTLIYDSQGGQFLEQVYRSYWDVANDCKLPMLSYTPTWRANQQRIQASKFSSSNVNSDCATFLKNLRQNYCNTRILLGGMMGPIGDCYEPSQALSESEAFKAHAYQAYQLAESGLDFLFASALPALSEAIGIAKAMSVHRMPYVLSFIIQANGTLLDGTYLTDAIQIIDAVSSTKPTFYMVNCVHPDHFMEAMEVNQSRNLKLSSRVKGFQANTSRKSPKELELSTQLETEDPETFAKQMLRSQEHFKLQFVGGCCGTDFRHIQSLGKQLL